MRILRLLAPLAVLLVACCFEISSSAFLKEETRSLDQLYQEAISEGAKLVVYHGGNTADQQDAVVNAFRTRFPRVNLTMVIDYSKYHDARVDHQFDTKTLVPDVVALQTLQDFGRWKKQDRLLRYKPKGFSKIYKGFVDPDGAWIAHTASMFTFFYDTTLLQARGLPVPTSVRDLAKPIYRGHIASSYPHDDDSVLFMYNQYVEQYGWDWLKVMTTQGIQFGRGPHTPGEAVLAKQKAIGVGGLGPARPTIVNVNGTAAGSPYLVWGQRMAILKQARHPAAAKLFLNWIISKDVQSTVLLAASSRTDVNALPGSPHRWEVPQASVDKFPAFMEDRATVERLKATLALYFGEVQGKPAPGELGLYPGL